MQFNVKSRFFTESMLKYGRKGNGEAAVAKTIRQLNRPGEKAGNCKKIVIGK